MAGLRVYCAGPSMGLAVSVARGAAMVVVVVVGGTTAGCKDRVSGWKAGVENWTDRQTCNRRTRRLSPISEQISAYV